MDDDAQYRWGAVYESNKWSAESATALVNDFDPAFLNFLSRKGISKDRYTNMISDLKLKWCELFENSRIGTKVFLTSPCGKDC